MQPSLATIRSAVVLAIACAAASCACDETPPPEGAAPGEQEIRAPTATVAELVGDPSAYDGQTVRVTGEVTKVLDSRAFLLRDFGLLWAPKIAVVAATRPESAARFREHNRVLVIGTVHARVTPELVQELGNGPTAASISEIGSGPVLIARSIQGVNA
jgi:hypothetical protein